MKKIGVFFAEGYEEIEALTVVDICRRCGLGVDMVSVTEELMVTGSHGIGVRMDKGFSSADFQEYDMAVLPGGMPGTKHLGACEKLTALLKKADEQKIRIGAICAAPSVLGDLGLLRGKKAVCYPGFEESLAGAEVLREQVVTDGHITTSRGMGTAIPFGLEMISCLKGEEEAERIAEAIIFRR